MRRLIQSPATSVSLLSRMMSLCEKAAIARAENLLPMGLSNGARLVQAVPQGTAITYDMVELDEDSFVVKLRRMQDATLS